MTRRRWAVAVVVLALGAVIAVVGWAQQPGGPGGMGPGMMGPGMPGMPGQMGMPGMPPGMGPVQVEMMKAVMGRSAIAVSGEQVYVLAGNRLLKYNSDLKVVRETEIKMDMGPMHRMMQGGEMKGPGMPQ